MKIYNLHSGIILLLTLSLLCKYSFAGMSEENRDLCISTAAPMNKLYKPTLISNNFRFLEGPAWSKETQSFYFSEMNFEGSQSTGPDSTIYQLKLPHTITTLVKHSGSNGLAVKNNKLITLNHGTRSVSTLDLLTNKQSVLVDNYQGNSFNSPNDVAIHSGGHIYFTDPDWQLGERTKELNFTGVYWLDPKGKLVLIDKTLTKPNGIVLSPDESTLYIGDYDNNIGTYPVNIDGSIGKRKAFVTVTSPDGITVDCAGNLYVASHNEGSIYVYSPAGKQLNKVYITSKITNIEFGGDDMKTLLITSGNGLFTLRTNVPGIH